MPRAFGERATLLLTFGFVCVRRRGCGARAASSAAEQIAAFQSLSQGPYAELDRWARTLAPGSELRWWEAGLPPAPRSVCTR